MQQRRRAAEERRREGKRQSLVRGVERELLAIARDAGEVDPHEDALGVAESERRGDPLGVTPHVGEPKLRRLAEQAANRVQLVHHAVEEHRAVRATQRRVVASDRGAHARVVVGEQLGEQSRVEAAALERVVRHVRLERRLERRHAREPHLSRDEPLA